MITYLQFLTFLTPNEQGTLVNSSSGDVRIFVIRAVLTGVDPTDQATLAILNTFMTSDRIAALQANSFPSTDPTPNLVTAGFSQAQAAAIVTAINLAAKS